MVQQALATVAQSAEQRFCKQQAIVRNDGSDKDLRAKANCLSALLSAHPELRQLLASWPQLQPENRHQIIGIVAALSAKSPR